MQGRPVESCVLEDRTNLPDAPDQILISSLKSFKVLGTKIMSVLFVYLLIVCLVVSTHMYNDMALGIK